MIQKFSNHSTVGFKKNNPKTETTLQKPTPKKDKDVYADTPVRLLGFTNEVGAALSPIIGPVGELLTYAPALSYIAMDTKDKYHRGDDNNYETPSHKRATKQLIFQMMASVILPTAAVKASQALTNKILDSKALEETRLSIADNVKKNQPLSNFIQKFADKPHSNKPPTALMKFAHKFEKVLNTITVAPLLFKQKQNKSGLRNIGLAITGLTTLALVIKPIDKASEHIISKIMHSSK